MVLPGLPRLILLGLCLALGGCGHEDGTGPSRAEGGLWRALFATQASRARLQWRNAAAGGGTCRASLHDLSVASSPLPDRPAPAADGCGIPHGVTIGRGPTGIAYQPALVLTCSMALLLPQVERIVQEEAAHHLGSPIARIQTFGTYSCRVMRGWRSTMSEHAFGNAVDVAAFVTADGRAISVERDFRRATPAAAFLHGVHDRLRAESLLSYVLGPDHDAAHHDHLHLDRGVRWTGF